MRTILSPYIFSRLAGQLLSLIVLHVALQWLLPILSTTLMKGMESWSNVAIVYCWLIQYAFIAVSIELRDTLIKKAQHWITLLPRQQIRMVLLLANTCAVLVLLSALWTLLKNDR